MTRQDGTEGPAVSAASEEMMSHRSDVSLDRVLDFECVALLLQGGGALGAYQGGVYQALAAAGVSPTWVAGISIGAINAAIIAGNPPAQRVEKLRTFWNEITAAAPWSWIRDRAAREVRNETARQVLNQASAGETLVTGTPGFFTPRVPGPYLHPKGTVRATSWYDTNPLRATLERLADFDRINAGGVRLSVGAVNVRTGNFTYFDTTTHTIRPEHIMASGALPPGFPAVEIDGEPYWDGGLVSNTPLHWVLHNGPRRDTLAFQVDLWNARGEVPGNLAEVATRQKEIIYSSRTRDHTDRFREAQCLRKAIATLLPHLPDAVRDLPEARLLARYGDHKVYTIVHLIYRTHRYEGDSKDYDFSRVSMEEHWQAGRDDTVHALRRPESLARPTNREGVAIFDFTDPRHK